MKINADSQKKNHEKSKIAASLFYSLPKFSDYFMSLVKFKQENKEKEVKFEI